MISRTESVSAVTEKLKIAHFVSGEAGAPRLSVLLPTFQPNEWFRQALRSVLLEAPADTQIGVVDDASPDVDVARFVSEIDPTGRVEVVRNPVRLGLAGNWNRAIALARGELIHLLHQDDYVLPGFYQRMLRAFQRVPTLGMAFCRTRIVDAADRTTKTTSRVQWLPGIVPNWLPIIGKRQRVQTPSAIVARSTYEAVGGFRDDLKAALDWEMWVRIASRFQVWYESATLAAYRRHDTNESSRLSASGEIWPDLARAISINATAFPPDERISLVTQSVRWYVNSALRTVGKKVQAGDYAAARQILGHLPAMLELLVDDQVGNEVERRIGLIREQLRPTKAA